MRKALFYETFGGFLHKCMFAGLDNKGNAQWMMVSQGDEVITIDQYIEMNAIEVYSIRLLCLEGEKIESKTMALLLGETINCNFCDVSAMDDRIEQLRRWGLSWYRDPLTMSVHVTEYQNEPKGRLNYRFYITGKGIGFVTEADDFDSLEELMELVRQYFAALEFKAGITIEKRELAGPDNVLAKVSAKDREMFDITK